MLYLQIVCNFSLGFLSEFFQALAHIRGVPDRVVIADVDSLHPEDVMNSK